MIEFFGFLPITFVAQILLIANIDSNLYLYRRQNYAIILVRNVSRRGSSLRRTNSKKNRDLERETEMLRQHPDKADNPKVK